MNVKRFIGRNSREAMQKVKAALGDEAIVLSTKPAAEGGIEILAMGAEGMAAVTSMGHADDASHQPAGGATQGNAQASGRSVSQAVTESVSQLAHNVQEDVKQLAMSTLSFQDYVRERMLKRRQAVIQARTEPALADNATPSHAQPAAQPTARASTPEAQLTQRFAASKAAPSGQPGRPAKAAPLPETTAVDLAAEPVLTEVVDDVERMERMIQTRVGPAAAQSASARADAVKAVSKPVAKAAVAAQQANPQADRATLEALKSAQEANAVMLGELRAMRAMVTERFETMAFLDKLGRTPAQATLAQRLLDGGFSTVLIRKLLDAMPLEVSNGQHDELEWATQVLQRNLSTADPERAVEDQGGIYALIGATGVGKTTTTAKLAATFAAKHGANHIGLITLDAYRVGAHEQLRAYGRILGVPVHTAHDRAALEDLLDLLSGKKLILIDTAGMAQRDSRTKELLDMLSHPSIKKLLVINASAQGDAIEDVMHAYQAHQCAGVVLSKLDEAVKLGPALDALIRHKLKVLGVANGQRVPEDWHRLSAQALVHRAMRASLNPAYRLDPNEVSLILATPSMPTIANSPDLLSVAHRA